MPSKKRSAAKPRKPVVYFLDRCVGVEPLYSALKALGLAVEIHDDHFPRDAEDRDWLAVVGSKGWIVLTKDKKIQYRPLEQEALRVSGARAFVLVADGLRGADICDLFVKSIPGMERILRGRRGPFIARITSSGRVLIWKEW